MANNENLVRLSPSEARENGRKGGKASGEARRRKANFRKTLNMLLTTEIDSEEWVLISREQFFDCLSQADARGMTDIQRAARFFCAIKNSFGTDLRSFGVRSRDMQATISYLQQVSKRLNRVVIENVDFERLIRTYDRESALFYLDPPYYEAEKYYPDRFNPDDHIRLMKALSCIKGKFVLSYNECPEIRELYAGYNMVEVDRPDSLVTKTNPRRYRELIIKNY